MAQGGFSRRRISAQFQLSQGEFQGGGNTALIQDLRVTCHVANPGGPDQGQLEMSIYGMDISLMNQLSNVGSQFNKDYPNQLVLFAGDTEGDMSVVFQGWIYTAFVDAQNPPNVALHVQAQAGIFPRIKPVVPLSIQGSGDVSTMMSQLAQAMGLVFHDNGVSAKLSNPYYWGSAWQQANQIARHAGILWWIDKGTLFISPPNKPVGNAVLISKDTGMIGYPVFNQAWLTVRTLYNPALQPNGLVQIESELTAANGTWIIGNMQTTLESRVPSGRWENAIQCYTQQGVTIA